MVRVEVDTERALMTISFRGHVNPDEIQQHRAQAVAAVEQLAPGFRLFTDLSGLESMDYECAPEVQAMMDVFRQKGVGLVVRVVPDPKKDIGFKIMSCFHYGREVPVLTFDSRAEALAKLAAT
jgi:hypothetical protein